MVTAMFAEMENSQYSARLIPERQNFTMNSSHEYLIKNYRHSFVRMTI
jgi:hypothetical protein